MRTSICWKTEIPLYTQYYTITTSKKKSENERVYKHTYIRSRGVSAHTRWRLTELQDYIFVHHFDKTRT